MCNNNNIFCIVIWVFNISREVHTDIGTFAEKHLLAFPLPLRQFTPSTLNDETDVLVVQTEIGDFELPLLSRREQPFLKIPDPVDCGCMLAGGEGLQYEENGSRKKRLVWEM